MGLRGAGLLARQHAAAAAARLSSAYPVDNFHTQNLIAFAKGVREAASGRLELDVRPNGELLKAADILPAVAGVDMGTPALNGLASISSSSSTQD